MNSGLAFAGPTQLIENGGFEDAGLFPWVGGGETLAVVAGLGGEIDPKVSLNSVLLATLFSASVGVFFGIYPANRAANLEPIEAICT